MDVNVISTGSQGNAVLLDGRILIDCGVTYKALEPYVKDLELVLCTHQHGDHFKKSCIHRLAKERPGLRLACGNWMAPLLIMEKVSPRKIDVIPENKWMEYPSIGVKIMQQPTLHDVPNCCWHINIDNEKAFYATDMATLEGIMATNYNLYLVEGNYKTSELEERMNDKIKNGEFSYEKRVAHCHFSEEQAMRFIADNAGPSSEYMLIHRHLESKK